MTKQVDELMAYVFEGQAHLLSSTLLQWMGTSTRFIAFVDTYRDKMRKKMRAARDPRGSLDLQGELEVAYGLLNDHRLAVAYEPYASAKKRSPDFAVTYRTHLVFNVEVAHLRAEETGNDFLHMEARIQSVLLDKLEQLQPGMPNLLVIHSSKELLHAIELDRLIHTLKTRAEGRDPAFYATSRYASPAAFYKDFSRLSGIVLWAPGLQPWVNKQARPALEEKVLRLVSTLPTLE